MFRRRRPLMRAAVVGGGAYMVGKSAARQAGSRGRRRGGPGCAHQRPGTAAAGTAAAGTRAGPAPAAAPEAGGSSIVDQLNQLAGLHQQGVLTDDEFAAAKAKLIGS